MANPCKICKHPAATMIDMELLQGTSTYTVAANYGLSASAVLRHRKNHLLTGQRLIPKEESIQTPEIPDARIRTEGKAMRKVDKILRKSVVKASQEQTSKQTTVEENKEPETDNQDYGQKQDEQKGIEYTPGARMGEPKSPLLDGKSQRHAVAYIFQELISEVSKARERKEHITAVVALKEAGNLALKAAKLWPDLSGGHESEEQLIQANEELQQRVREALAIPPPPTKDWEV